MTQIHYFNPGHETAVLYGLENYTPTANVQKMMRELTLLPAWYAEPEDYVLAEEIITPCFLSLQPKEFRPFPAITTRKELASKVAVFPEMNAAPWGISPHSLRIFKNIQSNSDHPKLNIPIWKEDFFRLTGRKTAAECLEKMQKLLPDLSIPVSPKFCTKLRDVEKYLMLCNAPFVLKTPYSSSGRGLHWLDKRKLVEKDRVWINGAINKQGMVSIECGLSKVQDFAIEFYSDGQGHIRYEGLSLFATEDKGTYSGNALESQESMKCQLSRYVGDEYFQRIQDAVIQVLQEVYGSVYTGYLGVDMLIYNDKSGACAIHPFIEINMRYTMGMVALRLFHKYIDPSVVGDFRVSYDGKSGEAYNNHRFMKETYPLKVERGKIVEGYLSLCPVTKDTHYRAYILII